MNDLNTLWMKFVEIVDRSPQPLFAGLVGGLALLLAVATITGFARLRSLRLRYRQLADNFDALSMLVEQNNTHLQSEIQTLSFKHQMSNSAQLSMSKESRRDQPAALMREELASLQMDLRELAPESTDDPAGAN
jgi:hypothetical protein